VVQIGTGATGEIGLTRRGAGLDWVRLVRIRWCCVRRGWRGVAVTDVSWSGLIEEYPFAGPRPHQ